MSRALFEQAMRALNPRVAVQIRFCPESGCWLWTGATTSKGHGQVRVDGTNVYVHRYVWESTRFPIAPGKSLVAAKCRKTACCNPECRKPMTAGERNSMAGTGQALAAISRAKTHCPQGHAYEGANLVIREGRRSCRACDRARIVRHRESRKARAAEGVAA